MVYGNTLTFYMETLKAQYKKYGIDPDTAEVVSVGTTHSDGVWYYNVTVKHNGVETYLLIPSYKEEE